MLWILLDPEAWAHSGLFYGGQAGRIALLLVLLDIPTTALIVAAEAAVWGRG